MILIDSYILLNARLNGFFLWLIYLIRSLDRSILYNTMSTNALSIDKKHKHKKDYKTNKKKGLQWKAKR